MVNISSYLFRKVLRVSAFGMGSGIQELLGSITLFNNVTFTNGQETTDITAGGVVIAQLDHSKTAGLNGTSPLISDTIIALMSGAEIENREMVSDILVPETIVITGGVGTALNAATGAIGEEIKFAYLIDERGNPTRTFQQDDAAGPGVFSYASATGELAFNSGEVPDGSRILIFTYPTVRYSKLITNDSNKFSKSAKIVVDIAVADSCFPDREYLMKIVFENGKFSGTYEWSIDGINPAEMSFEISSMLPCGETKLWDAFIFDEDDILKIDDEDTTDPGTGGD